MTVEHVLVVGLGDIKAVILECVKCGARYRIASDSAEIPVRCHCGYQWLTGAFRETRPDLAPNYLEILFTTLLAIRRHMTADPDNKRPLAGFRLLLEYDDPRHT